MEGFPETETMFPETKNFQTPGDDDLQKDAERADSSVDESSEDVYPSDGTTSSSCAYLHVSKSPNEDYFDSVIFHHIEDLDLASKFQEKLTHEINRINKKTLELALFGDIRSSKPYDGIEQMFLRTKRIIIPWTKHCVMDDQFQCRFKAIMAHQDGLKSSEKQRFVDIRVVKFFHSDKDRELIVLNDANPINHTSDDSFYESMARWISVTGADRKRHRNANGRNQKRRCTKKKTPFSKVPSATRVSGVATANKPARHLHQISDNLLNGDVVTDASSTEPCLPNVTPKSSDTNAAEQTHSSFTASQTSTAHDQRVMKNLTNAQSRSISVPKSQGTPEIPERQTRQPLSNTSEITSAKQAASDKSSTNATRPDQPAADNGSVKHDTRTGGNITSRNAHQRQENADSTQNMPLATNPASHNYVSSKETCNSNITSRPVPSAAGVPGQNSETSIKLHTTTENGCFHRDVEKLPRGNSMLTTTSAAIQSLSVSNNSNPNLNRKKTSSLPIGFPQNGSMHMVVPSSTSSFARDAKSTDDAQPKNDKSQPTAPKVSAKEEGLEANASLNEQNDQPSAKAKSVETALTVGSELQHSADTVTVKKTSTIVVTGDVKEEEMYGSGDGSGPDEDETIAKVSAADSTNPCRPPTTTEDVVEEDAEPGFPSAMPSSDEAGKVTAERRLKEGDGTEGERKGGESSMQILDIEPSAAGSEIEKIFEKDVVEKTFSDSEPNNNNSYCRRRIEIEPASQTEKLRGCAPLNCQDNFERMMPLKTSEEASGGFQLGEEEAHDISLWDSPRPGFKGLRGPHSLGLDPRPWPPYQRDTLNDMDWKVPVQESRPEPRAPPDQKPYGDFLDQDEASAENHNHMSLAESKVPAHTHSQLIPNQPTPTPTPDPLPRPGGNYVFNVANAEQVIISNSYCLRDITSPVYVNPAREPSGQDIRRGVPAASDESSATAPPKDSEPLATDDISNDEAPSSPERQKSFFGSLLCCGSFRKQPKKTKNLKKTTMKPITEK